jgi:hypothetical protein
MCKFLSNIVRERQWQIRSDNEPDEIENATHNTFAKLTWIFVFRFKKHKT